MKPKSALRSFLLLAGSSLFAISSAHADNGTWTADSNGNWIDNANWNSGAGPIADGANFTALFDDVITGNRIITNDGRTIGNITAADTTHNYTIQSNTLTLDVTSGSPTISVPADRTLTISSVIAGSDGFTKTGDGTATLSGSNTVGGNVTVSGGTVNFSQSGSRTLDVLSGSGDFLRLGGDNTLSLLDASAFQGDLRTFAGGNSSHTIEFKSMGDAGGAGNLQFGGGSGDSNQRTTMRLYGDVGPLTLTNRSIEILPKNPTPSNWSARGTNLENNNATAANKWVITNDLINITDRNHELTLKGSNAGDNEFAGDIGNSTAGSFYSTETGILSLIKDGAGKWILSGVNTYTGSTTIINGTLEIRGAGQLGGGNYAGTITSADTTPSPFTFGSSANQTLSGVISGTIALVKDGAGTLSLTGSAIHSGGTTVDNGTLSLGNGTTNASLSDFATLSVATGAVLDLDYTGSDAVFNLNLGGSPMVAGQYGHNSTGATNGGAGVGFYDAFFTANTGVINNLGGNTTSVGAAFWDGGASNIGTDGDLISTGGSGTWDAAILNWDYGTLPHAAWLNTTSTTAYFGGSTGTVMLGANMNIGKMFIEVPNAGGTGYFIGDAAEDNTLTFGGDKTITVTATGTGSNQYATIRAGIAGSPTINWTGGAQNSSFLALEPPTGVTMNLGTINVSNANASNKQLRLGGGSTGNIVDLLAWTVTNNQLQVLKSATVPGATATNWRINQNVSLDDGTIVVDEGTLTFSGTNNFVSHRIETQAGGRIVLKGNWRMGDEREDFKVLNGGIVAPGSSVGTATFNWNNFGNSIGWVDFQTGSTYEWEVGAGVNNTDVIALTEPVGGDAELVVASGTTLKVFNSGGSPSPGDQLTVFTYDAGVVTPNTATLNANMSIDLSGTTWTGPGTFVNDGAGTIYVTGLNSGGGPANPYTTWASTNAPSGNPDDDFDGDGVSNAVEFVLGGDKDTNDLNKLPALSTSGGNMLFTFKRDQDSIDASVSVEIEVGTTLAAWPASYTVGGTSGTSDAGVTVSKDVPGVGTDTVTLSVVQAPDTKKFARLKVVITP